MTLQSYKLKTMEEDEKWVFTLPRKSDAIIDSHITKYVDSIRNYLTNEKKRKSIESLDFQQLVNDSISNAKKYSQSNNLEISSTVCQTSDFYSDKYCVSLILDHIIENAVIYQVLNKSVNFIDINIVAGNKDVKIEIVDNGEGIERNNQENIFKIFHRFSKQSKGFGIGLYLVKDCIEYLEGHLRIDSTKGVGTYYLIALPNSVSIN